MKKIIILSGILCLLAGSSAYARVSVNLNLGEPAPTYVEAPSYVQAPIYPAYPVYPTYAVEGGRYHERHVPPPRRHFRHDIHRR